jgi:hypothetical protein
MDPSISPPKWKDNSCYIDTLLYTMFLVAPDIVGRIRPKMDTHNKKFAKKMRVAIRALDIQQVRVLMQNEDNNTDWLRAQQEPVEVIYFLEKYFVIPRNVYMRETIYGSSTENCTKSVEKLISDNVTRSNFASIIIDADVDKTLSLRTKENVKIDGWEKGYKYRGIVRQYLIDEFAMIHINRNQFGIKITSQVALPKRLQCKSLKAIIVHVGADPDSGHYISYIKMDDGGWIIYDDMKSPPEKQISKLPSSAYKNCSDVFYVGPTKSKRSYHDK